MILAANSIPNAKRILITSRRLRLGIIRVTSLTLNAQKYDEELLVKNTFAINTVSDNTDPIFAARPCAMKYENINRSPFILQYDNESDA